MEIKNKIKVLGEVVIPFWVKVDKRKVNVIID